MINFWSKQKNYFEGWYFKQNNGVETIAFIPALHIDKEKNCLASLQIITSNKSYYIDFKGKDAFIISPLCVRISNNLFSDKGMSINIKRDFVTVKADLTFSALTKLNYDIMGPFSRIPFMQCRHNIVSMYHNVNGYIEINNKKYIFYNGTGYIEKDCGRSFPDIYLWSQCCFKEKNENCSVMLSIAVIPFLLFKFNGCICAILYKGKQYRLATYLGAKIIKFEENYGEIKQGKMTFSAQRLEEKSQTLKAPVMGEMSRLLKESAACKVRYILKINGLSIFDFISDQAGFEFSDINKK